jgi:tRNA pseudouridine55 synthase
VPGTGMRVEVKTPEPSLVSASAIEIIATSGDTVTLSVTCSAGFYVRSLAHDLGARLGVGAHLAGLRRTRCAEFTAGDAVTLDDLERDPSAARTRVVPLAAMLPGLPAVVLTDEGVQFLAHGRAIGPAQMIERREGAGPSVRLIGAGGDLLGVAEPAATPGFLHPAVVLM